MTNERITDLEIQLAHATRTIEDLSAVLADQATRLDKAEKRIVMLLERAAEQESQAMDGGTVDDKPPPHW